MMMASAHVVRMGFISRQVLAHPNSPKGLRSQRVIMVTAQITVMVPAMACTHIAGNCVKLAAGAKVTIRTKTGTMAAKMVNKFMEVTMVAKSPCLTRLMVSSLRLAG